MDTEKEKFKREFIYRLVRFSIRTIKLCEELKQRKFFYSITDQLIRSATSIGANVVEAKAASSKRDYLKYFEIALKSANETKYWLLLVREVDKKDRDIVKDLMKETEEISNIIAKGILTMKGK
jgi:four helix bundle protein